MVVKIEYRKAGAWLAGSGLTFAALYLIGTAGSLGSKNPAPFFPYWIFIGLIVLGVGTYLVALARGPASPVQLIASSAESVDAPTAETGTGAASGDDMESIIEEGYRWQPDQIDEVAEPPEPEPVRPAITDRWRLTHSMIDAPGMAQLAQQGFGHMAYLRAPEKAPPWVRVRVVIACGALGENPGWQEPRGRLAGLLAQEAIRGLIYHLTEIPSTATWRHRGTQRRSWLEADLRTERRAGTYRHSTTARARRGALPRRASLQRCPADPAR